MTETLRRDRKRIRELRDPLIGVCIDNEFEIVDWIGKGAFSNVYRAEQTTLDRRHVALKVIRKAQADRAAARTGLTETNPFEHELHINRLLKHSAVVRAIKAGRTADGIDYVAMELVEGDNLHSLLREKGPLTLPEVVTLAEQLLGFAAEMHEAGCVHCDLKPDNLMMKRLPDGTLRVKVLDLGQARFYRTETDAAQAQGKVVGTPAFIAPEVARGAPVDPLAEVYACGTILYEALTALHAVHIERPVIEEYLAYLRDAEEPLPTHPIRDARDDVPDALADLIEAALSRDRDKRPRSANAFRGQLVRIATRTPMSSEGDGLMGKAKGALRRLLGK